MALSDNKQLNLKIYQKLLEINHFSLSTKLNKSLIANCYEFNCFETIIKSLSFFPIDLKNVFRIIFFNSFNLLRFLLITIYNKFQTIHKKTDLLFLTRQW